MGPTATEDELAALLHEHGRTQFWFHRQPAVLARVLRLIRGLPSVAYHPAAGAAGSFIAGHLGRSRWGVRTPLQQVVLVRQLVDDPSAGLDTPVGEPNRTSRKKARRAERQGVGWRRVTDPEEKRSLLAAAVRQEQEHPDENYRSESPDLTPLLGLDPWYVAHLDGDPLLLAVLAVDRDCAMLAYFRGLQVREEVSNARYLMSEVVADEARRLGVAYLCASGNPLRMPGGLRHFARSVGFRLARVDVG